MYRCASNGTTLLYILSLSQDFKNLVAKAKGIVFNPKACRLALEVTPEERSDADIEHIASFCSHMQFFAQLPDTISQKLFRRMTLHNFEANAVVFRQGEG